MLYVKSRARTRVARRQARKTKKTRHVGIVTATGGIRRNGGRVAGSISRRVVSGGIEGIEGTLTVIARTEPQDLEGHMHRRRARPPVAGAHNLKRAAALARSTRGLAARGEMMGNFELIFFLVEHRDMRSGVSNGVWLDRVVRLLGVILSMFRCAFGICSVRIALLLRLRDEAWA